MTFSIWCRTFQGIAYVLARSAIDPVLCIGICAESDNDMCTDQLAFKDSVTFAKVILAPNPHGPWLYTSISELKSSVTSTVVR